jgi:hypothetical protein
MIKSDSTESPDCRWQRIRDRAGILWTHPEVTGRLWRLGSESNRLSKCLLAMEFPVASACGYPVRCPAGYPESPGLLRTMDAPDIFQYRLRDQVFPAHHLYCDGREIPLRATTCRRFAAGRWLRVGAPGSPPNGKRREPIGRPWSTQMTSVYRRITGPSGCRVEGILTRSGSWGSNARFA